MKQTNKSGFTIVEISVVIFILAILAGVVYVGFGAWRTNIAQKEVKSDLNTLNGAMKNARNWNNGYPVFVPNSELNKDNTVSKNIFKSSDGVVVTYISGNTDQYCVNAQSRSNPNVRYYLNTTNSNETVQEGTCS